MHTELNSCCYRILAFRDCQSHRFYRAALFAGLASLTRTQGVFAAVCVGLWQPRQRGSPQDRRLALKQFTNKRRNYGGFICYKPHVSCI